jgi:hypothetical protein
VDKRVFREKFPGYAKDQRPAPAALEYALPSLDWARQRQHLKDGRERGDVKVGGVYHWGYCVDCLEPDRRIDNSATFNPCWPCLCLREGYVLIRASSPGGRGG